MPAPLRIGLFGTGHLGRIHLRCLHMLAAKWSLVGCCDPSPEAREAVAQMAQDEGWDSLPTWYDSPAELINAVDAIAIVTPTSDHARIASLALAAGKGCFIEKPVTSTLAEAEALLALQKAHGGVVQVGHVERFNPAFQAARHHIDRPRFIEAHRLAPFNPRGLDVPVVLDLMIHDIDLALHALEGDVVRVAANGVAVVGRSVDIANARLEFSSGAVANLTASRVSLAPMRKVRLFQPDAYLSVDLLHRSAQVVRLETVDAQAERDPFGLYLDVPGEATRQLHIDTPDIGEANAIADELSNFHAACSGEAEPQVSLRDGLSALRVAEQVMDCITHSTS